MKFSIKKLTSLTLGFSFLIMSYTGIMLYFVPKGKVAYWSDWHMLGLNKGQYSDLHTTSMLTFLFFGALHIFYNWKPIVSYLKDSNKKVSFTRKEFMSALLLNLLFVIGTLYMVQPFKAYLDLEDSIKEYWARSEGEPPFGHAEETKLKPFCKKMGIDYIKASALLDAEHIIFSTDASLQEIAQQNKTSPQHIFKLILPARKSTATSIDYIQIPSSLGRRTLQELSDMGKIDLQAALETLKEHRVKELSPDKQIKDIANSMGIMPVDLYTLIIKRK